MAKRKGCKKGEIKINNLCIENDIDDIKSHFIEIFKKAGWKNISKPIYGPKYKEVISFVTTYPKADEVTLVEIVIDDGFTKNDFKKMGIKL